MVLFRMPHTVRVLAALSFLCAMMFAWGAKAQIEPFVGYYKGSAELVLADGSTLPRDLSVEISETREGFSVKWSTTTFRSDGRVKEVAYEIDFVPSTQNGLYAAAMKKNVFGRSVQLDPMKGEPYVWGQLDGDTLTVYSLFVLADGGYEIQQYDRTLADGGLDLEFNSIRNGEKQRAVSTFLKRE